MLQAIDGTEAVLEGRRSFDAARAELPTAAPAAASAPSRPAGQPLNFFEHSKLIAQLEAQLHIANQRIHEADAQVKCALLVVAAEQSNVTRAEARLAEAEAAADAAREAIATEAAAAKVSASKFVADAMETKGIVVFCKTECPVCKKCLSILNGSARSSMGKGNP